MRDFIWAALTTAALVLAFPVAAQQPPAAPPSAGGTADGIPFDIPYGTPVSLETAKKLVAAAEAEATKHRWKLNIAVVDTHGRVHDTERLSVVDASIVPNGPAAFTHIPTIMLAERLSEQLAAVA